MPLFARVTTLRLLRTNISVTFRQSPKFMHYVQNTFSRDLRYKDFTENNSSLPKLISCNYSNKIYSEVQEDEICDSKNKIAENECGTETIFAEISNGDAEILKKLEMIKFECEVLKQSGNLVPDSLSKKDFEVLLNLKSVYGRKKYLTFLFKRDKKEEGKLRKKQLRKEHFMKLKEEGIITDPMSYNLSNQCVLLRVYGKTLNLNLGMRNLVCEDIAQRIIFDCSYQEYMNKLNTKFCSTQLFLCMYTHMCHSYPNIISLCNIRKTDLLYEFLCRDMPHMTREDFPWTIHEGSYLDHYPKENLVYLTPHCVEPLEEMNPNDIYIIGAFVDKGIGVKASLAEAKKNRLRMARFPIDEHIQWKKGTKSLPLNIVLNILLDMRYYNNWAMAFKHLPTRHYEDYYDYKRNDIIV